MSHEPPTKNNRLINYSIIYCRSYSKYPPLGWFASSAQMVFASSAWVVRIQRQIRVPPKTILPQMSVTSCETHNAFSSAKAGRNDYSFAFLVYNCLSIPTRRSENSSQKLFPGKEFPTSWRSQHPK